MRVAQVCGACLAAVRRTPLTSRTALELCVSSWVQHWHPLRLTNRTASAIAGASTLSATSASPVAASVLSRTVASSASLLARVGADSTLRRVGRFSGLAALRTAPRHLSSQRGRLLQQQQQLPLHQRYNQFSRGDNTATAINATAWIIFIVGLAYAAVPLYRAFCQATGYGGTVNKHDEDRNKVEDMVPVLERQVTVRFNADTGATMPWSFKPQQKSVTVVPGETALAFFTASNTTDEAITGISTYNVVPFEAGQYFNKIQCFCFEEQRLNPNEEVDMPVFFYIDPEFAEDPNLMRINNLTLSYTFFKSSNKESPTVKPIPATQPAAS